MYKKLLLLVILFFLVRLPGLGTDIANSDALRWHLRSLAFGSALKSGDLAQTYQRYHPGVTMTWIGAGVHQTLFTGQEILGRSPRTLNQVDFFPTVHVALKITLLLVLSGILFAHLLIISRVFSTKISYIYGFLMVSEPYMLGINRWVHLTSIEVFLGFLSFLLFLWFLHSHTLQKLVLAGVVFGFGLLTKVSVLLFAPSFAIVGLYYVHRKFVALRTLFFSAALFSLAASAVFILVFPAMWVAPLETVGDIFQHAFSSYGSDEETFQYQGVLFWLYYPIMLAFKLSPVALVTFVALLVSAVFTTFSQKLRGRFFIRESLENGINFTAVLVYFITAMVVFALSDKKIDRYVIALMPCLFLILSALASALSSRFLLIFAGAQALFLMWVLFSLYPVYSSYYSPLMGGYASALKLQLYDNSGEYLAQTASYLNDFGRDTLVYIPNNVDSFRPFFAGKISGSSELADYFIWTHDTDRAAPPIPPENCSRVVKTFGPQNIAVSYIFQCVRVESQLTLF